MKKAILSVLGIKTMQKECQRSAKIVLMPEAKTSRNCLVSKRK
jgi:hypothetical protein